MPRLLRCINNNNTNNLTIGKEYLCVDESDAYYFVLNDRDSALQYHKYRFEVIEGPNMIQVFNCCVCNKNITNTAISWPTWHRFPSTGNNEDGTDPTYCCSNCYCNDCDAPRGSEDCGCTLCKNFDSCCYNVADCNECELCNDCCQCWTCEGCDNRIRSNVPSCDVCSRCNDCCECPFCESCGTRQSEDRFSCSECSNCNSCCDCHVASGLELIDGHDHTPTFHEPLTKMGSLDVVSARKNRFMAVEIEVAESDPHKSSKIQKVLGDWDAIVVADGSLGSSGYEINTAPAKGNSFTKQINEICDVLDSANATVDRKCGLHVHIDCRDMRYYDLRKLLYVYCKVEQDLFSMISPRRTNNSYCEKLNGKFYKPLSREMEHNSPKEWKRSLLQTYYGANIKRGEFRKQKYNQNRYYALNVHSWFYRGTIEFRHHHGTVEATAILNWANICHTIVQYAMNNSETDIEKNVDKTAPLLSVLHDQPKLAEYFKDRKEFYLTR